MTIPFRRITPLFIIVATLLVAQASALGSPYLEIINAMNRLRRAENRAPLAINDSLRIAAERLLEDVAGRDLMSRGDILSLSDGTTLEQLLADANYPSYNGTYEADVITLILRDYMPSQAVDYWKENYRNDDGLRSKQMAEGFLNDNPIFFDRFREVGIAYQFNQENNRHYYVFIFASQPDVFPISITRLNSNDVLSSTTDPHVLVHVPNYVIRRDFSNAILQGEIDVVRISESPGTRQCPGNGGAPSGWETHFKNYEYTLSDGFGEKTLYVQLCDASGNTIMATASIFYGDNPPDAGQPLTAGLVEPRVLSAVYATQTAAVEATSYAEILPTVEAILTATATSQP